MSIALLSNVLKVDSHLVIHRLLLEKMGLVSSVYITSIMTIVQQKGEKEWTPISESEIFFFSTLSSYLQKQARVSLRDQGYLCTRKIRNRRLYKIHTDLLLKDLTDIENVSVHSEEDLSFSRMRAGAHRRKINKKRNENIANFVQWTPTLFFNKWNSLAKIHKFKRCMFLDTSLARKIGFRLREYTNNEITKFFEVLCTSEWLFSQNWFSIDWCVKDSSNLRKILEGQYSNKNTKNTQGIGTKQNTQWLEKARARNGGGLV